MAKYRCPLCGSSDGLEVHADDRKLNGWRIQCFSVRCGWIEYREPPDRRWWQRLARAAGAPTTDAFMRRPLAYLEPAVSKPDERGLGRRAYWPGSDVVEARNAGYMSRLWDADDELARGAKAWLRSKGIVLRAAREVGVGLGPEGVLTIPLWERGRIVGLKERNWRLGGSSTLPGYVGMNYPVSPLTSSGLVLLTEGETDMLAGRGCGLNAASIPMGVGNWRRGIDVLLGWRGVVCFDVGYEAQAQACAAYLGWHVLELSEYGGEGYDLSDFVREHGPRVLRSLVEGL